MSKSLGNLVFISDLLKTYDPRAIRLGIVAHHYRDSWEWNDSIMPAAAERLDAWLATTEAAGAVDSTTALDEVRAPARRRPRRTGCRRRHRRGSRPGRGCGVGCRPARRLPRGRTRRLSGRTRTAHPRATARNCRETHAPTAFRGRFGRNRCRSGWGPRVRSPACPTRSRSPFPTARRGSSPPGSTAGDLAASIGPAWPRRR